MPDEKCDSCKPVTLCEGLRADLNRLDELVENLVIRVGKVETGQEVNKEQTKMVFKILSEIKDSIKKIADKIDTIEKKPATRWEQLITTFIVVAATVTATYFITGR